MYNSPYRDRPQHSSDIQNYYDDSAQHPGYTQSPFDSTQNIPLGATGPTTHGGAPMYSQAAAHSAADLPDTSYQPGADQWLEKQHAGGKRSKWIIIGSILALVGLIVIGVVVGVVVSRNNSKSSSGSKPSSGSSSNPPATNQTDLNDPSTFIKNTNLHQSFYGLAYTPEGAQLPDCGAKLSDVIQDIQLMSQLTKRIRLYGADCNQSALVLEAIKQTKVDMTVWLGNYAIATDNNAAYSRQRDTIKSAIQTYGTDHIGGITVGNEFMLNYLNNNGGTVPDSDVGNAGAAILIADIQDTRNMLKALSLSKTIPVGTSDAGSYFNTQVLGAVDYGMANVHPWFANVSATDGAGWTADFFQTTDVDAANALSNKPKMYIAETGGVLPELIICTNLTSEWYCAGWPTKSSDAGNASNGPSTASEANLQIFMDNFVCQANTNGTGYFFFDFFDEPWKDIQFGGVEGWWGLFTSNRTLKNIQIPDCPSP